MRITLRAPHVDRPNGTARYGRSLAAALGALGHEVRLQEDPKLELRLGRWWLGGNVSARLARMLPSKPADVVHATTPYCNPRRAADVVMVHDIMPVTHPHLYASPRAPDTPTDPYVLRALEAHVVTSTEVNRRELLRVFPTARAERIHVAPLAADPERFHPDAGPDPALRSGSLNVLAVLSTEQRKRLDLVLEAAAALPFVHVVHVGNRRVPPVHQVAADRGAHARARLAAEGRLTELGAVDDARLRRLLSVADVVVHPSEAEGFGLPPLEALACGARVLASDIPAHREVLGDAVRYVALSADALARALTDAWDGNGVRDAAFPPVPLRLARAQAFTWRGTAQATLAAYEAALAGRRAGAAVAP